MMAVLYNTDADIGPDELDLKPPIICFEQNLDKLKIFCEECVNFLSIPPFNLRFDSKLFLEILLDNYKSRCSIKPKYLFNWLPNDFEAILAKIYVFLTYDDSDLSNIFGCDLRYSRFREERFEALTRNCYIVAMDPFVSERDLRKKKNYFIGDFRNVVNKELNAPLLRASSRSAPEAFQRILALSEAIEPKDYSLLTGHAEKNKYESNYRYGNSASIERIKEESPDFCRYCSLASEAASAGAGDDLVTRRAAASIHRFLNCQDPTERERRYRLVREVFYLSDQCLDILSRDNWVIRSWHVPDEVNLRDNYFPQHKCDRAVLRSLPLADLIIPTLGEPKSGPIKTWGSFSLAFASKL